MAHENDGDITSLVIREKIDSLDLANTLTFLLVALFFFYFFCKSVIPSVRYSDLCYHATKKKKMFNVSENANIANG